MVKKKILFVSGTRADFGKLKSLILSVQKNKSFHCSIFVTGMHLLDKYGNTHTEIKKAGVKNIYKCINQNYLDKMDTILAKTILVFSDYIAHNKPDLIVVHGDRVEALAGAIVGSLNNVNVAHIEGGEVSGTIDESIRHAVTKLSNFHFVSNRLSFNRIKYLGEDNKKIFNIGSPDIDIINSKSLPSIKEVLKRYKINFKDYAILIFHPVTTEIEKIQYQVSELIKALLKSKKNYVVIYPNNDAGANIIFKEYEKIKKNKLFRFLPSMRFEYFLSLLKNANFIIGNSSSAIKEAPYFGVPTINIGNRQHNRVYSKNIINTDFNIQKILSAIKLVDKKEVKKTKLFGKGKSAQLFMNILENNKIMWKTSTQKYFKDYKKK